MLLRHQNKNLTNHEHTKKNQKSQSHMGLFAPHQKKSSIVFCGIATVHCLALPFHILLLEGEDLPGILPIIHYSYYPGDQLY